LDVQNFDGLECSANVIATIESTVQSVISDFSIDMTDEMSPESAITDGNMHRVLKGRDLHQLFSHSVIDNILYYLSLKERNVCRKSLSIKIMA